MAKQPFKADKKPKKWLWVTLSIIGIFAVVIGAYVFSIYNSVEKAAKEMYEQPTREKSEKRIDKVEFEQKDPISVLIMGVDERPGDLSLIHI